MATRKKLTAALKVRAFLKTNPNAKPPEVAAATGVKVSVVYGVLWRDKTKIQTKKIALNQQQMEAIKQSMQMPITMEEPKVDMVNSPPHYKVGGIEVIDFIQAKLTVDEFRGYLQGNILKYSSRAGYKDNAAEDVGKLIWYANKLRETLPT